MNPKISDKILSSSGWCRVGIATMLGVFATMAQAPFYVTPLIFISFSGLFLLLISAKNSRQSFYDGWLWGLGYFTSGLYWICISLYVEPEKFAWLTPLALFGLPSILAIYVGVACFITWKIRVKTITRLLIFALCFAVSEYLRGHLFTGFPWNLVGYVWTFSDVTLQSVSLTGIYGLGFLTILITSTPALFLLEEKPWIPNILSLLIISFFLIFGWVKLTDNPTLYSNIKMRIVQPGISQEMKMRDDSVFEITRKNIDLTMSKPLDDINVVIWSEVAVPYYLDNESQLTKAISSILPSNTLLITGALRKEEDEHNKNVWNSLFVINNKGKIVASYDKHHLVPFGEFIPFRNILPLENIAGGHGDFASGEGAKTIETPGISPFSPLICYEVIFPEEATDLSKKAKWLLNITNDAWFGVSSGPYQHLAMARVRAVENNLPLVRVAGNGVSAVIDPLGRIVLSINLNKSEIEDFFLPISKP